jgi:hypothetical protein
MKKTMLTYKTLDRFERDYKTEHYTPEQIETIEHAAYVANMNQCNNSDWTEADIFADFLRVLNVHKIETETKEPETEQTAEADETETNEQEEETMKNYDYLNAICEDVREWIADEIDAADWTGDREGLEEKLNDDLFCEDSVTGNASGSYFCNAYRAKEAFMNDPKAEDYFAECCADFGMDAAEVGRHFIRGDYEYFDVTIRCYLLGQAIAEVLDELEEAGYFDEANPDEIAF